jgi:hypothetical protein
VSIALLVITDGRDGELAATVASAAESVSGAITERWLFDDTGDATHRARLAAEHPTFTVLGEGPRRGFGGAIRTAWAHLHSHSRAGLVFHLEADFTFTRPVDLDAMTDVLITHPEVVQMALRRQAWSPAEHAAGGVIEQHPGAYRPHCDPAGRRWLEHRLFFTTNPSLYRITLCGTGWPHGAHSEGVFTHRLLSTGSPEIPGQWLRFGYWGTATDPPWVTHIGHHRMGTGY